MNANPIRETDIGQVLTAAKRRPFTSIDPGC